MYLIHNVRVGRNHRLIGSETTCSLKAKTSKLILKKKSVDRISDKRSCFSTKRKNLIQAESVAIDNTETMNSYLTGVIKEVAKEMGKKNAHKQ